MQFLKRASRLVPQGIRALGIECRLRAGSAAVDLGVALTRESFTVSRPGLLTRFASTWQDPASRVHAWIPYIFLEYDESAEFPPTPSVFAALDSQPGEAESRPSPELPAALEFVELLLGERLDASRACALERGFRAVRGHSRILHIAFMLGRDPASIRLSILAESGRSKDYFDRIDSPDLGVQAERLIALLPERPAFAQLDFDVGPPAGARVGLGHRPTGQREWGELFERLVEVGACDPMKAEAAMSWRGDESRSARGARLELSHVKLALDGAGTVEAKLYLGATRIVAQLPDRPDMSSGVMEDSGLPKGRTKAPLRR